jgi:hypothetical protein
MKVVQELVAYFDRRGRLTSRQLKKLLDQNYVASDAPNNMHGLCDIPGAIYYFASLAWLRGKSGAQTLIPAIPHLARLRCIPAF